jgi:hypothetical protein
MKPIEFVDSFFKHGFDETDFIEMLEERPIQLPSGRGLHRDIRVLWGGNSAGEYLHAAFPGGTYSHCGLPHAVNDGGRKRWFRRRKR